MLYEAGIDALRFTMLPGTDDAKFVDGLFARTIDAEIDKGFHLRQTYHGKFNAVGTKHISMATGEKYNLYEVKSGLADEVANKLRGLGLKMNVTRNDWAVTFGLLQDREKYANLLREQVRNAIGDATLPKPGVTRLIESPKHANTLYIETADKTLMHRTYNKAQQSPGEYPPDAWRHEAEFTKIRAARAWEQFQTSTNSQWLARSYVMGILLQYGVQEPWMADTVPCPAPSKRRVSDNEKLLSWFTATIKPVVQKLLHNKVSQELIVRVLRDAGLDIVLIERSK